MPRVGVVVPAFNAPGDSLQRALASVLAQSHDDWDCVVVDDGSSEPVDHLPSRIRVIRQSNSGVSAARNRGVAEVSGEYLAFLDQDDLWAPSKLTDQLRFMDDLSLDLSDTGFVIVKHGRRIGGTYDHHQGQFGRLLSTARMGLSTIVVKREVFERSGGFSSLFPIVQDWEWVLRIGHSGARFDRLESVLCTYTLHDDNASKDYARAYEEQVAILTMYGRLDPTTRNDVNHGLRRMRELYAHQAIDAYRGTGEAQHLARAARLSPSTTMHAILQWARSRLHRNRAHHVEDPSVTRHG